MGARVHFSDIFAALISILNILLHMICLSITFKVARDNCAIFIQLNSNKTLCFSIVTETKKKKKEKLLFSVSQCTSFVMQI
jgi:hypothetical protein